MTEYAMFFPRRKALMTPVRVLVVKDGRVLRSEDLLVSDAELTDRLDAVATWGDGPDHQEPEMWVVTPTGRTLAYLPDEWPDTLETMIKSGFTFACAFGELRAALVPIRPVMDAHPSRLLPVGHN